MSSKIVKQRNTIRKSIKTLCVSTALLSVFSAQASAQQVKADGTIITVPTGTIVDTSGQGSPNGFGLYSVNGGVISGTDVSVITNGHSAFGVLAEGAGSEISMTGGSIRTSGDLSSAVATRNGGGTIDLDGVNIHTTGTNSDGVWAQAGGTIRVRNSTIQTDSGSTHGVWADGGVVQLTDTQITTVGTYGVGMFLSNNGTINGERVTINTQGATSHGVNMASGTLTLDDSNITTTGADAIGIRSLGGVAIIDNTTIETSGMNATGIVAHNSAYVIARDSSIATTGAGAFGVHAAGAGARADLVDTSIETTGNGAHGIVSQAGSAVYAVNVSVVTGGDMAHGATAMGDGSIINAIGGSFTTSGLNSAGLEARNGGHLEIDRDPRTGAGTLIHTTGDNSVGVLVNAGSANIQGATIKTEGNQAGMHWGSVGILATNGGTVNITDSAIEATGDFTGGFSSHGVGSHINMTNGSIHTTGTASTGATSYQGATAELTNVVIVTEQARGITAGDVGSVLTMNGGSILALGSGAEQSAVFAVRGATVNLNGVSVRTENDDARGLHAFNLGSVVNAAGSQITTIGAGSHGAFASTGGQVNLTDSLIETSGAGAHGTYVAGGATINASGSVVKATGAGANALFSSAADIDTVNSVTIDNSALLAEQAAAIRVTSGTLNVEAKNGTQISGTAGTLLEVSDVAKVNLDADGNVRLFGDVVVAEGGEANLTLKNNSLLQGAMTNVASANVDGTSYWQMIGSSDVGSLVNDGTIEFDSANPYKTLTVGTLDVNGGSFILNTKLNEGGASSETDKVLVTGDANGNGLINIRNNGGTGAYTGTGSTDGIQVVQIDGASNADFALGSAAVIGIYDYQLKKADGQNWYLQTEGEEPDAGHIVDIVPGYNIALSAAQTHVLTTLDTFHERVGELRTEEMEDGFHAWTRGIGKTGSYSPKSITGYNGGGFSMATAGVQIGGDYSLGGVFIPGDKLTVGLFGEYAHSNFDLRGRTADGSISSKGIGGYVTWQQNAPTDRKPGTGAYVDAVVKQDWLDFSVNAQSVSGFDLGNSYKGRATTASIETGYGFDLGNNVLLQPQAQLTYSKIKADSFTDSYGIAVHNQNAESLIGRLGVRLEKTFYFGDDTDEVVEAAPVKAQKTIKGGKGKVTTAALSEAPKKKKYVKSVTTFVDANVKREFKGKNGLIASDTTIGSDMSGTRYDVGAGVVAKVSENISLYGRGAIEFGGSTRIAGKVSGGLKITW